MAAESVALIASILLPPSTDTTSTSTSTSLLTTLHFYNNMSGDEGAMALAKVLPHMPLLTGTSCSLCTDIHIHTHIQTHHTYTCTYTCTYKHLFLYTCQCTHWHHSTPHNTAPHKHTHLHLFIHMYTTMHDTCMYILYTHVVFAWRSVARGEVWHDGCINCMYIVLVYIVYCVLCFRLQVLRH